MGSPARRWSLRLPDLFFQRVLGSTQVAHPCDSPDVVRYFLSTLAGDERTRDLAYFRLEECDRPRQLLGWEEDPGQDVDPGRPPGRWRSNARWSGSVHDPGPAAEVTCVADAT